MQESRSRATLRNNSPRQCEQKTPVTTLALASSYASNTLPAQAYLAATFSQKVAPVSVVMLRSSSLTESVGDDKFSAPRPSAYKAGKIFKN